MRRSAILLKGGQTFGWYERYMKLGPEGFKKNKPPKAFDWETTAKTQNMIRPRAYFDISIGDEKLGRLTFELAADIVPKTVENFRRLCLQLGPSHMNNGGYKGTKFHMVRKGESIVGGDIEKLNGYGNHSSYPDSRFIKDENYIIPHSERGLLSMSSVRVNSGGSQFYIDLGMAKHLNGKFVVFGRVVDDGEAILKQIESTFTVRSVPVRDVVITDCGYIEGQNVKTIYDTAAKYADRTKTLLNPLHQFRDSFKVESST